ncbi:MAG TPA: hypothetical protein VMT62_10885 [Syntrophorhabdaceae bacterium]|nr:hypothetical protein [Syntrophorhabdaceae bacterium]
MCEDDGYTKLVLKGVAVVAVGLSAIFCPHTLVFLFTFPVLSSLKVYHILWFLSMAVFVKRMTPRFNAKMSSGKIFGRNFVSSANEDTGRRKAKFLIAKRKTDSGAIRSGLYWILLLLVMWMWRRVGILPDVWLYVIVLFFVFMDQFCITVFCPFQWLMRNKCCNTCRINNWGYCMAFSPFVFIPTFWTYSILLFSVASLVQWEYLYLRHPERFYDIYNANLMCKNCRTQCRRKSHRSVES